MRPGGGKQKGAQFEREVCKALSLWISDGQQEDIFWRSAMSGGRATVAAKRGASLANQLGDISAIHPLGHKFLAHFVVECKYYRDLKFQTLFTGKSGGIYEFWATLCTLADTYGHTLPNKYGRCPLLVFKQNGIEPWLLIGGAASLYLRELETLSCWQWPILAPVPWHSGYLLSLNQFLNTVEGIS